MKIYVGIINAVRRSDLGGQIVNTNEIFIDLAESAEAARDNAIIRCVKKHPNCTFQIGDWSAIPDDMIRTAAKDLE